MSYTPPAAIALKTVKLWEHINAALESRKIPQEMAAPQHCLGLVALYDVLRDSKQSRSHRQCCNVLTIGLLHTCTSQPSSPCALGRVM